LKSELVAQHLDDHESSSQQHHIKLAIDPLVSRPLQMQLFSRYRNEMEEVFPFPVANTFEILHEHHPILLQAVIFAASPGIVSLGVQDELTSAIMKLLAPDEIAKSKKYVLYSLLHKEID